MKQKEKERKVYPMKFTKFIPVALALTMVAPAFAADAAKLSDFSEMVITVPDYVYIEKEAGAVEAANASFDKTYSTITLDAAMNATFGVVTNKATADQVTFTGRCTENGAEVNALGGTIDAMKLVFSKEGTATPAGSVAAALAGSDVTASKNAIAFALTPTLTIVADSGATAISEKTLSEGVANYTLPTAGKYKFLYTLGTTQEANTFSTHDTAGTYKAKITMTHAAL